ncbi:outer membrane transport energization protein TonB [Chitinophaga rupis]|uniref:Outer membrane transport energization protein TonB n=1 Tax=Chitinophaga rupis TaxID=573321 RepID=A0A1H8JIX0_9BACT|nr:M56 family metallopeptidase [Chitinophaga rupis]SEN80632.1 outer membrane transport energization protein TonB [Chitinophaga rupis]
MELLLSYLLKMMVCSGILYAYYHLALRNNRFHQWNRYYLLLATLLSLTLPLLQLPSPFEGKQAPAFTNYATQIITLREFILPATPVTVVNYLGILQLAYGGVVLLLLGRILYGCWKIQRLIQHSRVQHLRPYHLVQSEQVRMPFSFFRYIFWSGDINPDSTNGQQILQHELVHVTQKHSVDKLLMELVCAIGWVNPFFHLFKRELALVHEFIADQQAAGGQVADYAQTILQVMLQSKQLSMTNNFFHPPIQRRINMLLTQKSNFTLMKKFIVFPILAALVIFIGCQQNNDAKPGIIDITMQDLNTIDAENITSISATDNEAILKTKDGRTYRIKDYKTDLNKGTPLPAAEKQSKEVFTFVENPPVYPGGEQALAAYLGKNIRYPKTAQEQNVTGTVFVQFVVQADGAISDVHTVGAPKGSGLEEEAIRVVKEMPKWTPGSQQGRKVAVQFNLPIRYTLETSMINSFMLFKNNGKRC